MNVEIKKLNGIDWNKVQLVKYDDTVVMVTKHQKDALDDDSFCGVDLSDGEYSRGWIKSNFTPFTGEVILKND